MRKFFMYAEMEEADGLWMLEDPATCKRNADRILDMWRPFVEQLMTGVGDSVVVVQS